MIAEDHAAERLLNRHRISRRAIEAKALDLALRRTAPRALLGELAPSVLPLRLVRIER